MKNIVTIFFFLFCWGTFNVQGQTALEKAFKKIDVSMNIPSYFNVSQNDDVIGVAEVTKKEPLPTLAQIYGFDPGQGNTAINAIFGLLQSIFEHKNGEYLIFVSVVPGRGGSTYGKVVKDSTELFTLKNLSFGRIKHDFRYGEPLKDASELEADELYSMLTHYPREQAQEMFNANVMVTYPMNLWGSAYKDKYTRSRAVVIAKDRLEIYLYFMMTDESAKNFDTYLQDLNKVFWFNE